MHLKSAFGPKDKGKMTNDPNNRFNIDSDQEEVVSEEEDMVLPALKPRLPRSAEKKKKKKARRELTVPSYLGQNHIWIGQFDFSGGKCNKSV